MSVDKKKPTWNLRKNFPRKINKSQQFIYFVCISHVFSFMLNDIILFHTLNIFFFNFLISLLMVLKHFIFIRSYFDIRSKN